MSQPDAANDDFLQIKGIGQSTAHALHNAGIHRFIELANHTPESLSELLKTTRLTIAPQRIERDNWIGQARELAHHSKQPASSPGGPPLQSASTLESRPQAVFVDWYELSDFFVSFGYAINKAGEKCLQTKVEHSRSGQSERWNGIVTTQLLDWILNRANIPQSEATVSSDSQVSDETLAAAEPETVAAAEKIIELSDLRVYEIGRPTLINGRLYSSAMRAEYKLDLSESARKLTYDQLSFNVELLLFNSQTGSAKPVTSALAQFEPDVMNYRIEQNFPPPGVGRYQLYVSARLLPPGQASAQIQGPVIRVEA
jgi:hypothetical protein